MLPSPVGFPVGAKVLLLAGKSVVGVFETETLELVKLDSSKLKEVSGSCRHISLSVKRKSIVSSKSY